MNEVSKWLLEGDPWVEYRTRVDLLGQPENEMNLHSSNMLYKRFRATTHPNLDSKIEPSKPNSLR